MQHERRRTITPEQHDPQQERDQVTRRLEAAVWAELRSAAIQAIKEGWQVDEPDVVYSVARKLGVELEPGEALRLMADADREARHNAEGRT